MRQRLSLARSLSAADGAQAEARRWEPDGDELRVQRAVRAQLAQRAERFLQLDALRRPAAAGGRLEQRKHAAVRVQLGARQASMGAEGRERLQPRQLTLDRQRRPAAAAAAGPTAAAAVPPRSSPISFGSAPKVRSAAALLGSSHVRASSRSPASRVGGSALPRKTSTLGFRYASRSRPRRRAHSRRGGGKSARQSRRGGGEGVGWVGGGVGGGAGARGRTLAVWLARTRRGQLPGGDRLLAQRGERERRGARHLRLPSRSIRAAPEGSNGEAF